VIGKWFKRLEMKASDVMWGSNIGTFGSSFLPTSRCSEPCGPGEVKKMTEVLNYSLKKYKLFRNEAQVIIKY
jgi:hypothetical protein